MKDDLKILNDIQKVEAPPFLLTRIKQQIENSNYNKFSFKFAITLGISFIILLILNTSIILNHFNHQINSNQLTLSSDLISNNSLYNE